MMTAQETDAAIDAKLATNLETLKGIFQVKGNYLTREDLTNTLKDGYITKNESDRLYQGVGNYATIEYVDDQIGKNKIKIDEVNTAIANKLDVSAATSLYQTKGDYVLRSELDTLAITPTFANAINTAIVGKGYLDKETADGYYAPKGQYVTTENIEDAIATSAAVTAKQDALTFGNGLSYDADTKTLTATGTGASVDLSAYATKAESDAKYGPKDTLTEDQKGVVESILRDKNYATNADLGSYSASMDTSVGQLRASINTLKDTTVPAIDTRVTALEGKAAPTDFTEDQKTKLNEILTGKHYATSDDIDNAKAELKNELATQDSVTQLTNQTLTAAEGKVNEAKEALEGKITELKNTVDGIHTPDLSAYETQAQAEAKYLKLEDIETKLKEKGFITQADLQPILDAIKALKGE